MRLARIYHVLLFAMIGSGFVYGVVRAAVDDIVESLYGPNGKLARLSKLAESSKYSDADGMASVRTPPPSQTPPPVFPANSNPNY